MYGLPESFDATVFVGRSVEQVCFTTNQITVHFDDDLHVTIQGEFSLRFAGGTASASGDESVGCSGPLIARHRLVALIGSEVVSAVGTREGTLTVEWKSGEVFSFSMSHRCPRLIGSPTAT